MLTATITGRLGRDPEIKAAKSGKKYAELNVAESTRRNVNGTYEDVTTWVKVLLVASAVDVPKMDGGGQRVRQEDGPSPPSNRNNNHAPPPGDDDIPFSGAIGR